MIDVWGTLTLANTGPESWGRFFVVAREHGVKLAMLSIPVDDAGNKVPKACFYRADGNDLAIYPLPTGRTPSTPMRLIRMEEACRALRIPRCPNWPLTL